MKKKKKQRQQKCTSHVVNLQEIVSVKINALPGLHWLLESYLSTRSQYLLLSAKRQISQSRCGCPTAIMLNRFPLFCVTATISDQKKKWRGFMFTTIWFLHCFFRAFLGHFQLQAGLLEVVFSEDGSSPFYKCAQTGSLFC